VQKPVAHSAPGPVDKEGEIRVGECLIRAPFPRALGALILSREFGTPRPGVAAGNRWGRFRTGNGTSPETPVNASTRVLVTGSQRLWKGGCSKATGPLLPS